MSDESFRELERATLRAPEDPSAWLAFAQGAARSGARADAIAAFYRAAALGADLAVTRVGLRALGAPPSPWGHSSGDARRSRCSPLVGPRAGEVVARAPVPERPFPALGEDGTVLVGQYGGTIARFDGRTLDPRPEIRVEDTGGGVWPCVGAGLVVATTESDWRSSSGTVPGIYVVAGTATRRVDLALPGGEVFAAPLIQRDHVAIVRSADRKRVEIRSLGGDLAVLRAFDLGWGTGVAALDQERIACCSWEETGPATLGMIPLEGGAECRGVLEGSPRDEVAIDARGRVLVATDVRAPGGGAEEQLLTAFGRAGEPEWSCPFRDTRDSGPKIAAAADGGCAVISEQELVRIDASGRVTFRIADRVWMESPVFDRDGVLYVGSFEPPALVALDPDGEQIFALEGLYMPKAIDAWNRLLAVRPSAEPSERELVAIR